MSNTRESFRSTAAVVMYFSAPRGWIWSIIGDILCNLTDFNICACYCAAERWQLRRKKVGGVSMGERSTEGSGASHLLWQHSVAASPSLRCKRLLDSVKSVEVFWVWSCWVLEKLDQGKGIESWKRVRHSIAWKGKEAYIKTVLECLHCNITICRRNKICVRISIATIYRGNTGAVVLFTRFFR